MLFDRIAELIVGQPGGIGLSIKDLRFAFNIQKTASETLNDSTIKIYNLNPNNRALVEAPNNAIILKAGYKQDIGALTIFVGIVRRSLTYRENTDWITELELDDGLISYRDSKTSIDFAPGTDALSAVKAVAEKFNLPVRPLPTGLPKKTYPQGFSFVGRVREAMTKVCNFADLEWSIQNQEIQVLKKGGTVKNVALLLSPDTGMIGSPALEAKTLGEKKAASQGLTVNSAGVIPKKSSVTGKPRLQVQGYKVRSLLQPTVQPGGIVQVKSKGIDGEFFRVESVAHRGDTMGQEWETEMSLRFIQ